MTRRDDRTRLVSSLKWENSDEYILFVALIVGSSQLWSESFRKVRRDSYLSFYLSVWPL